MIFTHEVLGQFAQLLTGRMATGTCLTEDAARYCLFTSIHEKAGISDNEILLEDPHPGIKGAKLDSFLPPGETHGACAWELKYDRAIPSGKNQPRSNKAGGLLNDFFRLAAFDCGVDVERVVVYLTDAEMASYFRNPRNGLTVYSTLLWGSSSGSTPP
jgi:hypothetical protein